MKSEKKQTGWKKTKKRRRRVSSRKESGVLGLDDRGSGSASGSGAFVYVLTAGQAPCFT